MNKYLRQSLTFVNVEPRWYITQTNLSRTSLSVSDMSMNDGSFMNVAVVSGRACHVLQAVFFPLSANCEVVSDPVKALKKGRELQTSYNFSVISLRMSKRNGAVSKRSSGCWKIEIPVQCIDVFAVSK